MNSDGAADGAPDRDSAKDWDWDGDGDGDWDRDRDREHRRDMLAEVHRERDRLLPLRAEATETTIELMRTSTGHVSEPDLVPYLNLMYLLTVKRAYGDDQLLAFALSLANWAVVAIDEVAHHTGRTAEQVIDQYETEIMAARESNPPEEWETGSIPETETDSD
ncbi:hypothetical protein [Streptomyces deccanensis]|uniref:hypothetical protein n=2 Tax=Streptomyces TaxID=1883 RepID=UPI001EFB369D|nr:hypothetical protein [Streptomyces deccanensis]ULR51812.1 hypothetical protein L3078_22360 [Streptomyces deccanensis]